MLISPAHAQAAASTPGSEFMTFLPMIAIFVVFYFLLIRPQAKRAKEHKAMVEGLQTGDEVVASGGMLGRITETGDSFVTVEIADGVRVKIQRASVSSVLPKGTIKSA